MAKFHGIKPELTPALIRPKLIKSTGNELTSYNLVERQIELARARLVPVDLRITRGTCVDERGRLCLLNGAPTTPRPSVPGGPDIYLLATRELTGYYPRKDKKPAIDRLKDSKNSLNDAGLLSGGHLICLANDGLNDWLEVAAKNPDYVAGYARQEMGDRYDEEIITEVIDEAGAILASGRYDDWGEAVFLGVLGDEAGEAIEKLVDEPHKGLVVVRNSIEGYTCDQTRLYDESVVGKGVYDVDEWYASIIEHVATSGPDAQRAHIKALHAREVILASLVRVVPNPELYEARFVA